MQALCGWNLCDLPVYSQKKVSDSVTNRLLNQTRRKEGKYKITLNLVELEKKTGVRIIQRRETFKEM